VAIAKLPAAEALNAQLAGVVASPITGLVRGLGSMIQGLALQLGTDRRAGPASTERHPPQRKRPPRGDADGRGSPSEEAPSEEEAPAEEAPADEAPAADEPAPDPEPAESPEESSEEEAPEGEDAGQGKADETPKGTRTLGEEPQKTSEDSDENKEDDE